MSEEAIEQAIQDKNLNEPRLTPDLIDNTIVSEDYHVFNDSCLTVCCLTLKNGFTVTGTSACASPKNFDEQIGQEIARENAREKIWMLEGYLLKQRLYETSDNLADRLSVELDELCEKISKLREFIASDKFKKIKKADQKLLIQQKEAMDEYITILRLRFVKTKQQ